jgi:hypothetical protein
MMLVKHESLLTHKRHTTTGVEHRRAESRDVALKHVR